MLIVIISDIHDNLMNLEKCLKWSLRHQAKKIICCGDVTNSETVNFLATNFPGEIFLTAGNLELYNEDELAKYKNINYCGEIGIIEIDGLNIGLCHEPEKIDRLLESSPSDLNFIFCGHTHKPWLEKRGSGTAVNPGNLAGVWHQATFATLETDTKKLALKIVGELTLMEN